jgi:glycosyltransferase involved in cell wall biosynthesis
MPSVLYLSYDGALDPLGQSQIVPYVEGLALRGFKILLLSFEKKARLEDRQDRQDLSERLDSAGILWHPMRYHSRPPLISTAGDLIHGLLRSWPRHEMRDLKLIHARSYPSALLGSWLSRHHGSPLLFDIRGFYPEERVEGGYWPDQGFLHRIAKSVEGRLLSRAAGIVTLTESSVSILQRELERRSLTVPIRRVPTCVDLGRFKPAPNGWEVRRSLGIGGGPVIVHVGTLGGWYLGDYTFRLAGALLNRMGGEFVVLTEQGELAGELALRTGVPTRQLSVRHRDVPKWLSISDLGLAMVRPGFSKVASSPTKVAEYLASGMAVLSTAGVGDLFAQFEGSPIARAISPREFPESVAVWAEAAIKHPDRQEKAREMAREHYDLDRGIDALADFYLELGVRP